MIIVVKLEGQPSVCRTDEVGEICVAGAAMGDQYWGLQGMTNATFKVQPLLPDNTPMSDSSNFVRTGLLGFLGPVSAVYVVAVLQILVRNHLISTSLFFTIFFR